MSTASERERKYIRDWIRENGKWHICDSCMLSDCICGSKESMLIGMATDAYNGKGDKPVTYLEGRPLAQPKLVSKQRDCPKCGCKKSLNMTRDKTLGFSWKCRDCGQHRELYCSQESIAQVMIANPRTTPTVLAMDLERTMLCEDKYMSCPKCGLKLHTKEGRYGMFMACPAFPRCSGTRNMDGTIGGKSKHTALDKAIAESLDKAAVDAFGGDINAYGEPGFITLDRAPHEVFEKAHRPPAVDYDKFEADALMMKEVKKAAANGDALSGALLELQSYAEPFLLDDVHEEDQWVG